MAARGTSEAVRDVDHDPQATRFIWPDETERPDERPIRNDRLVQAPITTGRD